MRGTGEQRVQDALMSLVTGRAQRGGDDVGGDQRPGRGVRAELVRGDREVVETGSADRAAALLFGYQE